MCRQLCTKTRLKDFIFCCVAGISVLLYVVTVLCSILIYDEIVDTTRFLELLLPLMKTFGYVLVFAGFLAALTNVIVFFAIFTRSFKSVLMGTLGIIAALVLTIVFGRLLHNMMHYRAVQQNENAMQVGFSKYNNSTAMALRIDSMQRTLRCCGVNNFTDWFTEKALESSYENDLSLITDIPFSCCKSITIKEQNVSYEFQELEAKNVTCLFFEHDKFQGENYEVSFKTQTLIAVNITYNRPEDEELQKLLGDLFYTDGCLSAVDKNLHKARKNIGRHTFYIILCEIISFLVGMLIALLIRKDTTGCLPLFRQDSRQCFPQVRETEGHEIQKCSTV